MEAPRGVEPTGTNGRTRHTFRPACWVGSRPVVVSFVGWQGALFLVVTMTIPVKRFCSRPLSGSRTATIGIGRVAGSVCRPIPWWVGRYIGFAVVMAQVRRPVPFRTRKLRPGRGDGTALERVWESSTPPHSTYGPSGRAPSGFPEGPFLFPRTGVSSAHWRFSDAGRTAGGMIPPSAGGFCSAGRPVGGMIPPPTGCFVPPGGPWAGGLFQ